MCFLRRGGVAALAGRESTGSSTRAIEVLALICLYPIQGGGGRAGPAPRGPAGLLTVLILPRPRPSEEQDGADAGRGKKGAVTGGAAAVLRSRRRGRQVRPGPATSALPRPLLSSARALKGKPEAPRPAPQLLCLSLKARSARSPRMPLPPHSAFQRRSEVLESGGLPSALQQGLPALGLGPCLLALLGRWVRAASRALPRGGSLAPASHILTFCLRVAIQSPR